MSDDPYAFHAVVLAYGATREELAAALEAKAADIRAGYDRVACRPPESHGADGVLIVRQANTSGGEESLFDRMHMVFHTESESQSPALAMFSRPEWADRFARGLPLWSEEDGGPGRDLGVSRVDLVGTWWNSIDPDPTEAAQ